MPESPEVNRILIVDDHEVVRRGISSLFDAHPDLKIAAEADCVATAMKMISDIQPDLVLLDISLKGDDGFEVLRLMKDQYPQVPVLVLSMHDEAVYAERALRAGAKGYVKKLDAAQTIISAVRKVLSGQIHVSEQATASMLQRISGGKSVAPIRNLDQLSDRELQVLRCIGTGLSNREIADKLFISVKTVESHREHIKQKIGLQSSSELLRYAIEFSRHS